MRAKRRHGATVVGIPLAYALARRRFHGRSLVDLVVTLPLILPPTVTGYYLIVLLGRRGVLGAPLYTLSGWTIAFTPYAAVIAATVMALPLLVRQARAQQTIYYSDLAEELGMCPLQAHCHLGLGTLYAKTGQQEEARIELSTALELYRAMEMTFWLPQVDAALAQMDTR